MTASLYVISRMNFITGHTPDKGTQDQHDDANQILQYAQPS